MASPGTPPVYTADDHKRAYLAWRAAGGKITEVERNQNISGPTLRNWRGDSFVCPFGCPYHGWEKLEEESRRVADGKSELVAKGNFDPVATGNMIEAIVGERPVIADTTNATPMVLTERQRLAHWYYVYCHVFYQLTEIPLDHLTLKDALSGTFRVQATDRYGKGLRFTNAADAVRVLAVCGDQIRTLEASINGFVPGGQGMKQINVQPKDPLEQMSPTQLRDMITQLKKDPVSGLIPQGGSA